MKLLFALFLIAHGLIHLSYFTPKPDDPSYPFDFTKGWLTSALGNTAQTVGTGLVILTAVCFVLAGLGALGIPGLHTLWQQLTVAGAIASITLIALFWHPWLAIGLLINIVLIYGLLTQDWQWVG